MSELLNNAENRISFIIQLFERIATKDQTIDFIRAHSVEIQSIQGEDIIIAVDQLFRRQYPLAMLKQNINKLINVLGRTIQSYNNPKAEMGKLEEVLNENYRLLDEELNLLKPDIQRLNKSPENHSIKQNIYQKLQKIQRFTSFYEIKENILFPILEKHFSEHGCLAVMWSFHDDIRSNMKLSIKLLEDQSFDLNGFNRAIAALFFNMHAIKLRDVHILFPFFRKQIEYFHDPVLLNECIQAGFPYFQPHPVEISNNETFPDKREIKLDTGHFTLEQLELLFKHLPVDITYVDENDKVCYFSDPPHRIFPRSKAIIGRDVHQCHPPESIHIVHDIIESFKSKKNTAASFWINLKGKKLFIQYFAIRDTLGVYKGVLEVSQDITSIQKLTGEKRLPDWN